MQTSLFASGRQDHGIACDQSIILSGFYSPETIPRCFAESFYTIRKPKNCICFSPTISTNRRLISPNFTAAVETSNSTSMDQTTSAKQSLLRYFGEPRSSPSVDRYHHLSAVAIFKKSHRSPASLCTILQVLSVPLFEKTPILQVFSQTPLKDHEPQHQ